MNGTIHRAFGYEFQRLIDYKQLLVTQLSAKLLEKDKEFAETKDQRLKGPVVSKAARSAIPGGDNDDEEWYEIQEEMVKEILTYGM